MSDLIISAYRADPSGKSEAGQAYIIFGTATSSLSSSATAIVGGTVAGIVTLALVASGYIL
ncbi:MAG: hypothetical protein AB8V23_03270 [Candidatus Midichloria sp.]